MKGIKKYVNRFCIACLISCQVVLLPKMAFAIDINEESADLHKAKTANEMRINELEAQLFADNQQFTKFSQQITALEMKKEERQVANQQKAAEKDSLTPLLEKKINTFLNNKNILEQGTLTDYDVTVTTMIFPETEEIAGIKSQLALIAGQKKLRNAQLVVEKFQQKKLSVTDELLSKSAVVTAEKTASKDQIDGKKALLEANQQQLDIWDEKETELTNELQEYTKDSRVSAETIQHTSLEFGYQLPVKDPVSSDFGLRSGYDSNGFHKGIDFASASGTNIHAALAGEVVVAQENGAPFDGYGKVVLIRHDNGMWTLYAHQSKLLVKAKDRVETGEVIGEVGSTGDADGAHLHFEVRTNPTGGVGAVIDPAPLLGIE